MAAPLHYSVVYDVDDFQVAKLLTDVTTAPTYDTLVDVPGVASVSLQPGIKSAELKGDAKVLARKGNIDRYAFSAVYGKLSLDALAVLMGGTSAESGTTPNIIAKWTLSGSNQLPYFKALFRILNADVADVHVTAWKCQATGGTLIDQSTDNFGQPKIDFEAIACVSSDAKFVDIEFFETATPLA